MVYKRLPSKQARPLAVIFAILLFAGCDDGRDTTGPTPPGGDFTIYGVVDANSGTVKIAVGFGGLPVTDAEVHMNGRRIPVVGNTNGESGFDPLYRLDKLKIKPGDVFHITVECSAGSGEYSVTMPEQPQVVSPQWNEFFSDFAPVPVIWNPCAFATQYAVRLGGVLQYGIVAAPDTSYVFSPDDTVPGMGLGIAVEAINGDGGYSGYVLYPWTSNGIYAISSYHFNISILD